MDLTFAAHGAGGILKRRFDDNGHANGFFVVRLTAIAATHCRKEWC
jgi:hypothetical protein